ncbi:MAG: hypothetical protein K2Q22_07300 [Cytophagales bacterium]|nr:hypothetical protein [Cytophagales bacterium]
MTLPSIDIVIQIIGWIGSFQVVAAYYLVSTNRISSSSTNYQVLNLIGGACLILLTIYLGAYPSAFVNVIWVIIAAVSLFDSKRGKKGDK